MDRLDHKIKNLVREEIIKLNDQKIEDIAYGKEIMVTEKVFPFAVIADLEIECLPCGD